MCVFLWTTADCVQKQQANSIQYMLFSLFKEKKNYEIWEIICDISNGPPKVDMIYKTDWLVNPLS